MKGVILFYVSSVNFCVSIREFRVTIIVLLINCAKYGKDTMFFLWCVLFFGVIGGGVSGVIIVLLSWPDSSTCRLLIKDE